MVVNEETGSSTSRSLIERLRLGDGAAWSRLVGLYSPLVEHWCRRAALQPEDSADVVQEVFRAVSTGIERFRKTRPEDTFRGWLRIVTANKIRDHFRAAASEPPGVGGSTAQARIANAPAPGAADGGGDPAEREVRSRILVDALENIRAEFESRTFEAFRQTAIEDRAIADVASDLGMSPGAVRVAKSRVLRRLRVELGDGLGERRP
jgi:RNA polymerase sigma-70 factor (ECF subfamily)